MGKKPLLCIFILALSGSFSFAGVRHFTFLYEANTSAPGNLELENWVTWQRATGPGRFDQVDFRHELEYGVTDGFQLSIYLADWSYENGPDHSGSAYSDSAVELIYNLTNPVVDPLGLSLYGELRAGDRLIELESKLIAQKKSWAAYSRLQCDTGVGMAGERSDRTRRRIQPGPWSKLRDLTAHLLRTRIAP